MKNLIFFATIIFSFSINAQVWIEDSDCNSKSRAMVNEAIDHMTNLEPLVSMGLAKAALIVDNKCECAKLVLAAISSPNPNWGSRKSKLEKIDITNTYNLKKTLTRGRKDKVNWGYDAE